MLCPCGSTLSFTTCCQPFITTSNPTMLPRSAEQLMRSRFSAYAIKNAEYIFNTYAEKQRENNSIDELQSWANECQWIALIVHNSSEFTVEFSAYFIVNNTLCELRELSHFTQEEHNNTLQWRYVDGVIKENKELSDVKRNAVCPCNQFSTAWSAKKGKKYKHCCGQ